METGTSDWINTPSIKESNTKPATNCPRNFAFSMSYAKAI